MEEIEKILKEEIERLSKLNREIERNKNPIKAEIRENDLTMCEIVKSLKQSY